MCLCGRSGAKALDGEACERMFDHGLHIVRLTIQILKKLENEKKPKLAHRFRVLLGQYLTLAHLINSRSPLEEHVTSPI